MTLWIIKLLSTVRRAMAGRKYPHQMAWAVAFGLLLGVVPHGNLLAAVLLMVVLSLKINHAMAGLTAVVTTFLATWLDPYSHQVGDYVLTHPLLDAHTAYGTQLFWPFSDERFAWSIISIIDPLFTLPPGADIAGALFKKNLFKVAFTNSLDETAAAADLVFPILRR